MEEFIGLPNDIFNSSYHNNPNNNNNNNNSNNNNSNQQLQMHQTNNINNNNSPFLSSTMPHYNTSNSSSTSGHFQQQQQHNIGKTTAGGSLLSSNIGGVTPLASVDSIFAPSNNSRQSSQQSPSATPAGSSGGNIFLSPTTTNHFAPPPNRSQQDVSSLFPTLNTPDHSSQGCILRNQFESPTSNDGFFGGPTGSSGGGYFSNTYGNNDQSSFGTSSGSNLMDSFPAVFGAGPSIQYQYQHQSSSSSASSSSASTSHQNILRPPKLQLPTTSSAVNNSKDQIYQQPIQYGSQSYADSQPAQGDVGDQYHQNNTIQNYQQPNNSQHQNILERDPSPVPDDPNQQQDETIQKSRTQSQTPPIQQPPPVQPSVSTPKPKTPVPSHPPPLNPNGPKTAANFLSGVKRLQKILKMKGTKDVECNECRKRVKLPSLENHVYSHFRTYLYKCRSKGCKFTTKSYGSASSHCSVHSSTFIDTIDDFRPVCDKEMATDLKTLFSAGEIPLLDGSRNNPTAPTPAKLTFENLNRVATNSLDGSQSSKSLEIGRYPSYQHELLVDEDDNAEIPAQSSSSSNQSNLVLATSHQGTIKPLTVTEIAAKMCGGNEPRQPSNYPSSEKMADAMTKGKLQHPHTSSPPSAKNNASLAASLPSNLLNPTPPKLRVPPFKQFEQKKESLLNQVKVRAQRLDSAKAAIDKIVCNMDHQQPHSSVSTARKESNRKEEKLIPKLRLKLPAVTGLSTPIIVPDIRGMKSIQSKFDNPKSRGQSPSNRHRHSLPPFDSAKHEVKMRKLRVQAMIEKYRRLKCQRVKERVSVPQQRAESVRRAYGQSMRLRRVRNPLHRPKRRGMRFGNALFRYVWRLGWPAYRLPARLHLSTFLDAVEGWLERDARLIRCNICNECITLSSPMFSKIQICGKLRVLMHHVLRHADPEFVLLPSAAAAANNRTGPSGSSNRIGSNVRRRPKLRPIDEELFIIRMFLHCYDFDTP